MDPQVKQYLEELYQRSVSPPDATPLLPSNSESTMRVPVAPVDNDIPLVSLATGQDVPESMSLEELSRMEAQGYAARRAAAQPAPVIQAESPASYLDALTAAQERDRMMAVAAGALGGVEQAAQIMSRGLYRPMGMPRVPSAVAELQQRQRAVEGYLEQQRGVRAEARQERATEADIELSRVQQAREAARMEAEKLRLAMEQGEAPYKVVELQANVRKALAQAQLAEETAKARGRPVVVVGRPPKEPKESKAAPGEKLRQLPATTVEELSSVTPAINTLTDLTNYYKSLDLGGFITRQAAKLGEAAPEKIQMFEAAANPVRQVVGKVLEGGKLADSDIQRYLLMLPKPGNSDAVVDKKLQTLTKVLNDIRAAKVKELREAGFQVGGEAPAEQPAPQANPVAPSKEDFARAAVAAFKRAQESGATPEVLERLRNEAQAAIKAAGG